MSSTRADIDRVASCPFFERTNQISLCHRRESAGLGPVERFRDGVGKLKARSCLTWHVDDGVKYHIPIVTTDEAFFVTRMGIHRLTDLGRVHLVRTDVYHTAINASPDRDRIVLALDAEPDSGKVADTRRKLFRRISR